MKNNENNENKQHNNRSNIDVCDVMFTLTQDFDELISSNEVLLLYAISLKSEELFKNLRERCKSDYVFKESIGWLINRKFIKNNSDNKFEIKFSNLSLVNQAEFNKLNLHAVSSVTTVLEVEQDRDEFIDEWYSLWPVGVKTSNYLIRSGKKAVKVKMNKFLKQHPEYSEETILKATEEYIKRFKIKGYAYIKTASYFIYKDGESVLAGECEKIEASPEKPKINFGTNDSKLI